MGSASVVRRYRPPQGRAAGCLGAAGASLSAAALVVEAMLGGLSFPRGWRARAFAKAGTTVLAGSHFCTLGVRICRVLKPISLKVDVTTAANNRCRPDAWFVATDGARPCRRQRLGDGETEHEDIAAAIMLSSEVGL